jgi:hypothetical protein
MSYATLMPSSSAVSNSSTLSSWQRLKVGQFLAEVLWEGQVNTTLPLLQPPQEESLSLTLTVNQFFAAINWEGKPIALTHPLSSPDISVEEFTLADFSDLF